MLRARSILSALVLALLGLGLAAEAARGDEDAALAEALEDALEIEEELIETCADVRRATVSVLHKRYPRQNGEIPEGAEAQLVGVGSGVLVERKSRPWVITNVHVVQGADVVEVVSSDGVVHPTVVHDTIRRYDIALLAFPDRPRDIHPVRINTRASKGLEVGAWVVATGNPFFLALDGQPVTTMGVVSGKDRILGGGFLYGNAIQHDAEVNPGNSGGPLWDLRGDLVGINGMIASRSREQGAGPSNTGASFSIPIHQVNEFLIMLIERDDATAGYLGVDVETVTDEDGGADGARVTRVDDRGPAASSRTAITVGDVITSIWMKDWHRVNTASDLTNILSLCPSGTYVKVRYKRGRRAYIWTGRLTEGR